MSLDLCCLEGKGFAPVRWGLPTVTTHSPLSGAAIVVAQPANLYDKASNADLRARIGIHLRSQGTTTMYTLYYAPGACSLASHITLEELGVPYERRRVDFGKTEQQSEAYRSINPKARVPTLITPGGSLTETPAILAFLAQSHPEAALAPVGDPFAFAELQAFNSYLCSTVHVAHAHSGRGQRWADDQDAIEAMKRKVPETMTACFQLIEDTLIKGPWVMGENYSVADPYLFTVTRWAIRDTVDISRFPKVSEHHRLMSERPATVKVQQIEST
jgi:glutathione S-transferase